MLAEEAKSGSDFRCHTVNAPNAPRVYPSVPVRSYPPGRYRMTLGSLLHFVPAVPSRTVPCDAEKLMPFCTGRTLLDGTL